jgi:hypothetical protein
MPDNKVFFIFSPVFILALKVLYPLNATSILMKIDSEIGWDLASLTLF